MSIQRILTRDIEPLQLTDLFCQNQKSFYCYIAKYAASADHEQKNENKPLRFHKIDNKIDCIFSPNVHWSFYNAILDADICDTIKQNDNADSDQMIKRILSLASHYKCPIRSQVKPTAIETEKLLKRYGFFCLPSRKDSFQYIDLTNNSFQYVQISSDINIYELDDSTQSDCQRRKAEWGLTLPQSFGLRNLKIHGPFYSKVWSNIEVGPTKPIRMFIAVKNDRVVGGCHASLACGVACLFNVTTLKNERGKGIGKALSIAAMISAKQLNYRYMVLQATKMGSHIYKQLGFQPLPSYKIYVKLSTAASYYKIIEILIQIVPIERLERWIDAIRNISKSHLFVMIITVIIIAVLLVMIFG